jgi:hypothetical protein
MVIDSLAAERSSEPTLADLNTMSTPSTLDFGIRGSGSRINRVIRGSNADGIGLRSGDVVLTINNRPAPPVADVAELLRGLSAGQPLLLTVARLGEPVRLTGRYAPTRVPGESDVIFPRLRDSGRVDLVRTGNRVEAKTRGVAAFTLLVSPDQFDVNRPVTVAVNGRTMFDGVVRKDLRTLLKWAAVDNDRTMLFAAELQISAPR